MRLVLDTNVVASAMLWGGTPKLLLQARRERRVTLHQHSAIGRVDRHLGPQQIREKDHGIFADGRSIGRSLCGVGAGGAANTDTAYRIRSRRRCGDRHRARGKGRFTRDRRSAFALGIRISGGEDR